MPWAWSFSRCLEKRYDNSSSQNNSKKIVNNYRPVSVLPICSEIFKKLIFDSIYDFSDKKNLFSNNQSRFRPSDSCTHQLIVITHNIFSGFNGSLSLEVRGVLLDLFKALIEFGMMVSLINARLMELRITSSNLLNRF